MESMPLDSLALEDLVNVALLGAYGLFLLLDALVPARRFPKVARWRLKGLFFMALYVGITIAAPMFWDAHLAAYRVVDLTSLGTLGGAAVAVLVLELFMYWWHRALHEVPFLWRIHQMHHSAERVDIWGAFYFHPVGMVGWALTGSLALVWAVGVTPEAAILATAIVTFLAVLGHANLRTPRWLGWLIARPEMHAIHHERGVHAHNYGDIALFDQIFGTWRNPATWDGEAGLVDGGSARMADLLLGRDLLAEEEEPTGRPSAAPSK